MLLYLAIALQIGSAVAAALLAWRRADHRPFAAWSVGTVVATLARAILAATVLPVRPLGSPPFVGAQRLAFHVDQALFLASDAGLAALAIWLFAERRRLALLPALAWAGTVVYLAAQYPEIRGDALRQVYLAAQLGALAVGISAIASLWWRRGGMTSARQCLLCCVAVDGGTLFVGAWRWGFWDRWSLNQVAFALLYAVLAAYQGVLWSRSCAPRS
jgi:hypothetical protein